MDDLIAALDAVSVERQVLANRIETIRIRRQRGEQWRPIVADARSVLVAATVRDLIEAMTVANGAFQRTAARVLHDEGVSMDRIAALFGVTRQRVSRLLKDPSKS